jgi:Protein of unknown function (DUF421)
MTPVSTTDPTTAMGTYLRGLDVSPARLVEANLRKAHIVEDELKGKLRLAGIRGYEDVALVILERTGEVSVLQRGETISDEMLADVHGR